VARTRKSKPALFNWPLPSVVSRGDCCEPSLGPYFEPVERLQAFIGLGSNLGDREWHLQQALAQLQHRGVRLRRASSLYESGPVGPVSDQPSFLNAVVDIEADGDARQLLQTCMSVERALGRQRTIRKGPRCIDLDLLMVGAQVACWPELVLPHPALTERAFVLLPLLELEPRLTDPRDGRPLARYVAHVTANQAIQRRGAPSWPNLPDRMDTAAPLDTC